LEIIVRAYKPEDDPYIYSTWSKYAWYSPKEPIKISKANFFRQQIKLIKDMLEEGHVGVACIKETPYVIMGYIVVYQGKILWMCIKKDFQNQKIDQLLLNSVKGILNEE
jgi:hypothetical protein